MIFKKQTKKTNGTRHMICLKKELLNKYNRLVKNLIIPNFSSGGRNQTGRITVRHKGGGCKKSIHYLNYYNKEYAAINITTFYDSKKSSLISLNFDLKRNFFFKTISIKNIYTGSLMFSQKKLTDFRLGFRTFIKLLPIGSIINSINKSTIINTTFARSAGSFSQILEVGEKNVKIRLPSGEIILIDNNSLTSLGVIGNSEQKSAVIGKAGRTRLSGIRPSVRGVAMNPVDHPHGGKSNKGKPPVTPWGLPTKNQPTKKRKK